jgi:hypothetical protein
MTNSKRLPRALGGITAIALATVLLSVGPAPSTALLSAAPAKARHVDPGPTTIHVVARASGPNHFNSQVDVDMPAGGNALVTSPTLDPNMTAATVTYTPLSAYFGFEQLAFQLLQAPTPGKRLVFCLTSTAKAMQDARNIAAEFDKLDDYYATEDTLFLVRMSYCIQVAKFVAEYQAANPRSDRLASTRCGQAPMGFKEVVTQSGGTYTLGAAGPLTVNKKKARVKISCKVVGQSIVMTVKPKKKGSTLRKAIGQNLNLGMAMPGSATAGVSLRVAFKAR